MNKEVVWLVSFGLAILAIIAVTKMIAPQINSQEIRHEPPPVETSTRS